MALIRRKPRFSTDPAAPLNDREVARDVEIVRKGFWQKVSGRAKQLGIVNEAAAGYYAMLDRRTPMRSKATLAAALAYFVLPIDVIPDMLLGLGFTDDVAVLTLALGTVSASIRPEHRDKAAAKLAGQHVPDES